MRRPTFTATTLAFALMLGGLPMLGGCGGNIETGEEFISEEELEQQQQQEQEAREQMEQNYQDQSRPPVGVQ